MSDEQKPGYRIGATLGRGYGAAAGLAWLLVRWIGTPLLLAYVAWIALFGAR